MTIELSKGQHKQPEFLARQPFGQIPVLVDGDIEVFESRAIVHYLLNTYDKTGALSGSGNPKTKAIAYTWLEVEHSNYNPPVSGLVSETLFKPVFYGTPSDPAVVAEKTSAWEKVLDVYEAHLAKHAFLAGDVVTFADLSHLPYTQYALDAGSKSFESRPHLKAWWEKISSRPSWVKVNAQK